MNATKAIVGATMWDGTGAAPVPDSVLLVSGAKVTAVGPASSVPVPPDAERIDARGKWLIPGLIDLHVHLDEYLAPPGAALLWGVTSVRDVGSRLVTIQKWRARAAKGEPTPRLFWYGRNIDQGKPSWSGAVAVPGPAQVPALLDEMQKQGVDGVKLYVRARPDVSAAVIRDAHRRGLPVTGHLEDTSASEAARMGIDNLEHVSTLFGELAPTPPRSITGYRRGFYRAAQANLNSAAAKRLIDTLAAHHVAVTATLAVSLFPVAGEKTALPAYRGWADVPKGWRTYWNSPYWSFVRPDGWSRADFDIARRAADQYRSLIGRLYKAGVRIVAGTDTPAPWVLPGAGLLREIELLHECGLTTRDALLAATGYAAQVMQRTGDVGTLAPGTRPDFILLHGSPLNDLRVLRRPDAVYQAGKPLDLSALRRAFSAVPAPPPRGPAT